jgi:hypothetical protein
MAAKPTARDTLRHVRLETGHTLHTWDTGRIDWTRFGHPAWIGYEFRDPSGTVLFTGSDFHCSPLDADDSDACVRALLGFLSLRPGDTDAEYFAGYTAAQLAFAESGDAELIAFLFGCDDADGELVDVDADDAEGGAS